MVVFLVCRSWVTGKGEMERLLGGELALWDLPNGQSSPRRKLLALTCWCPGTEGHRQPLSAMSARLMQCQPQESHSDSTCHILQGSKHNHIISTEHKACFILGIQPTTGFHPEQISRLLINSSHRCIYAKTPQAVFSPDQQT